MAIRLTDRIPEKTTSGVRITLYDSSSNMIIPNSLDWYLFDSRNVCVASGSPESMSSSTLITLGSSLMLPSSNEVRSELVRLLRIEATYADSELGTCIENEVFVFTMVNNPGI